MPDDPRQFARPGAQGRRVGQPRRHGSARKVARHGAVRQRGGVVAQLEQRIQCQRHRPGRQRSALPARHCPRQAGPGRSVDAGLRPGQHVQRTAAARGKEDAGLRHALFGQPGGGDSLVGRRQLDELTAAAQRGQQPRRVGAAQQQPGAWRGLFQRLQQCVRRLQVERLGRVQHRHLGAAARAGAGGPVDERPHFVDADLLARLALAVLAVDLVVTQRPGMQAAQRFGHQHEQIGVQVVADQMAAAATAAGRLQGRRAGACRRTLAQPGLGQAQREGKRADAFAALHQQRVAALRVQRALQRRGQPWQWGAAVVADQQRRHHARPCKAVSICRQTASRGGTASTRTKRCGSARQRRS